MKRFGFKLLAKKTRPFRSDSGETFRFRITCGKDRLEVILLSLETETFIPSKRGLNTCPTWNYVLKILRAYYISQKKKYKILQAWIW